MADLASRMTVEADPSGRWADLGTIPLVAAFDIGRLRIRLWNHMLKAWCDESRVHHREEIVEMGWELGRRARLLRAAAEERDFVQEDVRQSLFAFERALQDKGHETSLQTLGNTVRSKSNDPALGRLSAAFLKPVMEINATVGRILVADLNDRDRLAMKLGEYVEQGLGLGETHLRLLELGSSLSEPSDLDIHENWLREIVQLAIELGIGDVLPLDLSQRTVRDEGMVDTGTELHYPEIVDRMDKAVRTALANRYTQLEDRDVRGRSFAEAGDSHPGSPTASSQPQLPSHGNPAIEKNELPTQPDILFQLHGGMWHLRYTTGGRTESGDYPNTLRGLKYYEVLFKEPGKIFSAIDMIRRVDGTIPPVESAQLEGLSQTRGTSAQSYRTGWTKDPAYDKKTEREVRESLSGLRAEHQAAKEKNKIERAEELSAAIKKAEDYLRAGRGKGGRPRALNPGDEAENARKSVSNRLSYAKKKISDNMPDFAIFLGDKVEGIDYGFVFRNDDPKPRWTF